MTSIRRLRPLLLLLILPLALLSLRETRRVSACVGRGGSIDPATGQCDAPSFQADRPPPLPRQGEVLIGAVLAAAAGAGVAVWLRRRALRGRGS